MGQFSLRSFALSLRALRLTAETNRKEREGLAKVRDGVNLK